MRLTDITVRTLPLPAKGQRTYFDEALPSFGCRVSQGGTRSFVLQIGADRQLITIGRYHPDILPLAKARAEAKRILAERVLGKHRPKSVPFEDAKTLFLEHCRQKNRPKTVRDYTGIFRRHLNFGTRQLSEITTHDIDRRLDRIEGAAEKRYATVVAKLFFKWCRRRHYIDTSPCERIEVPAKSTSRARVLSDDELKLIWRSCSGEMQKDGSLLSARNGGTMEEMRKLPPSLPTHFANIVRLLMLTGQRRGEIAALQTSWIQSSAVQSVASSALSSGATSAAPSQQSGATAATTDLWTITFPKEVTKNGREHSFPVASSTRRLLQTCLTPSQTLCFPARGASHKPFNGWSKSKAALDKLSGVKDWTLHDLRRTYRTIHARIGTPPHIAERLVNHISAQTDMERVYDQYRYMPEMRAAQEAYEAEIARICENGA